MPKTLPDEISLEWFLKNRGRVREAMNHAEKPSMIVGPEGQLAPEKTSRGSINKLYDLRIIETSADPLPIAPPVLSLTVDDPDQELDLDWTLPETYNELFLERSEDGETWTPLATLPGTQDAYEDGDVTPGQIEYYRIRGRVGGAYSAYSNVVSGELETSECEYELPTMAANTAFFQGFADPDFSDALWGATFNFNMAVGDDAGSIAHAGNLYQSEDGKKVIVRGAGGSITLVVTRNGDNSFTVETLNDGGSTVAYGYTMSRTGIVAGKLGSVGAVWLAGVTSAATTDAGIEQWNYISPDGLRLYGITTGGDAIERVIGGADTTIHDADEAFGVVAMDHCGTCVIVETDEDVKVYKKVDGVWTHTATLAGDSGANYPKVVQMTGDGSKAFGNPGGGVSGKVWMWDLTGTGTLTATNLGIPADTVGGQVFISGVASNGSVVTGHYIAEDDVGSAIYWLSSESYATAHNLDTYLIAQGLTEVDFANGYLSIDNVTASANGSHFVVRASLMNSGSADYTSMYYAAVPTPT